MNIWTDRPEQTVQTQIKLFCPQFLLVSQPFLNILQGCQMDIQILEIPFQSLKSETLFHHHNGMSIFFFIFILGQIKNMRV